MNKLRIAPLIAFLCFLINGCASVPVSENIADYTSKIAELEQALRENPESLNDLRDLGAIYVRTGDLLEGNSYLTDGYALGSRDPKLLFYLGLANEGLGKRDTALRLYEMYTDVPGRNEFRRLMSGRYSSLIREISDEEMRKRVANEASISSSEVIQNALAIFAFEYQGTNELYSGIGRGLAEWISLDLLKVSELRVLERVRLQSLIDEIQLGASGYVDPSTAPRAGRLLRAETVVSGTYNVMADNRLRVVPSHVSTSTSEIEALPEQEDELENFFRIEKRIVFSLLSDLGIELTEAEQNAIDEVPTRDIQAFLAYSRGLLKEDQRDFRAAAEFYEQASEFDPEFDAANANTEAAIGMSETFGPSSNALASSRALEPLILASINPVSDRLNILGLSIQTPMIVGEDARKPAAEAIISSGLKDPPPPPRSN